jgi:hypothetical protein
VAPFVWIGAGRRRESNCSLAYSRTNGSTVVLSTSRDAHTGASSGRRPDARVAPRKGGRPRSGSSEIRRSRVCDRGRGVRAVRGTRRDSLSLDPAFSFWKVSVVTFTLAHLTAIVGVAILEPWYRGIGSTTHTALIRFVGASAASFAALAGWIYLFTIVNNASIVAEVERSACRTRYINELVDQQLGQTELYVGQLRLVDRLQEERVRVAQGKLPQAKKRMRLAELDARIEDAASRFRSVQTRADIRLGEVVEVLEGGPIPSC